MDPVIFKEYFGREAAQMVLIKQHPLLWIYRKEFVSVGVTKQENSFNQEIDDNDTKLIWERILQYVPSLKVYLQNMKLCTEFD